MINISISHRSIKIGAIFIAVLLLSAIAIPAGSQQTFREGIVLEIPFPNPDLFDSPFLESLLDSNLRMYTRDVQAIGLMEIGETKHVWARVHLTARSQEDLGIPTLQLLYIPGPRLQSLFELAKANGDNMQIDCHEIVEPEGWDLIGSMTLYKVTSAVVYKSQIPGG